MSEPSIYVQLHHKQDYQFDLHFDGVGQGIAISVEEVEGLGVRLK